LGSDELPIVSTTWYFPPSLLISCTLIIPLLFLFLRMNTLQSRAGTPSIKEKTHQTLLLYAFFLKL